MAEREEIEISQLELAEELAPDWVMPVESATKTWATTLEKIRQFFGLDNKTNLNMDNLNADGKSLISELGMPGGRYVDLTLGVSGTVYTAPANGWVSFDKTTTGAQWVRLTSQGLKSLSYSSNANISLSVIMPVKKGNKFVADYEARGQINLFRFIYAEGEEL